MEYVTAGTFLLVLLVLLTLEGLVGEQNREGSFDNLCMVSKTSDIQVVRRQHRYMGRERRTLIQQEQTSKLDTTIAPPANK